MPSKNLVCKRMPLSVVTAGLCLGVAGLVHAHMELGGHLNVTGSQIDTEAADGSSEKVSDVNVTSLGLGLLASPHRNVDAHVVWLLEEFPGEGSPDQSFAVDQAFVTISGTGRMLAETGDRDEMEDSSWYLHAGKMYVPFATNFEYHTFDTITEPETLALGETLETMFQIGYSPMGPIHAFGGIYGGRGADGGPADTNNQGDDELNDVFLGISGEFDSFSGTASWISNLNDSISLIGEIDQNDDAVAGMNLYGSVNLGPAWIQVSYVSAMDDYTSAGLDPDLDFTGMQPSAINGEVTFAGLAGDLDVTGVFGATDEWPGHPESTYGIVIDKPIYDGITLSGEYLHKKYDQAVTPNRDSENIFAVRLSTEFGAVIVRRVPTQELRPHEHSE